MKPRRRVLEDDLPEMDCIDMVDMREELDMREDSSLPSESRELASVLEPWDAVEAAESAGGLRLCANSLRRCRFGRVRAILGFGRHGRRSKDRIQAVVAAREFCGVQARVVL